MKVDGIPTLPEETIPGIDTMLDQLLMVDSMLTDLSKKGSNVESEQQMLRKLHTEINLIKEILKPKFKQYEITNLKILFKHFPQVVRQEDKRYYKELTNENPTVAPVINPDSIDELEKTSMLFRRHFKINIKTTYQDELFDFLVNNEYISKESDRNSFSKLFELEAIPRGKKLIWTDKVRGKPSLKVLCRLFLWLTDHLTPKEHFGLGYPFLIPHYFKTEKGELNSKSIPPLMTEVNKVDDPINPRESLVDMEFKARKLQS